MQQISKFWATIIALLVLIIIVLVYMLGRAQGTPDVVVPTPTDPVIIGDPIPAEPTLPSTPEPTPEKKIVTTPKAPTPTPKPGFDYHGTEGVIYKTTMASRCTYNGATYYQTAEATTYDGGGSIFDSNFKYLGSCNYSWGQDNPVICDANMVCVDIYVPVPNIFGKKALVTQKGIDLIYSTIPTLDSSNN